MLLQKSLAANSSKNPFYVYAMFIFCNDQK